MMYPTKFVIPYSRLRAAFTNGRTDGAETPYAAFTGTMELDAVKGRTSRSYRACP